MAGRRHHVTIDGTTFQAQRGALLLDAALSSGVALPHDCRAGHCGTCCVRLVSGEVDGGAGVEPGIIHACRSRVVGDVVVESGPSSAARSVSGLLTVLRPLSADVVEVGIKTSRAFPYLPGQYAQLQFAGFPRRPFSITHPVSGEASGRMMWFHIRRMRDGHVTSALGRRIMPGRRVTVTGPFGSAHYRPNLNNRLLLVGTSTGFAPIWSIAVAALRESPQRPMMVIAGGRSEGALYMAPALLRLARFPNVVVVPVCSSPNASFPGVYRGRPTDYVPQLMASDVVYACGAPAMVDAVQALAAHYGVVCHADPFMTSSGQSEQSRAETQTNEPLAGIDVRRMAGQLIEHVGAQFDRAPRASAATRANTRANTRASIRADIRANTRGQHPSHRT